jgi:hypothetical protein
MKIRPLFTGCILVISFLFLQPQNSYAQMFNAGIKLGLNSNSFVTNGAHFDTGSSKIGFAGGLFIRLQGNFFWAQTGAMLSHKSGMFSYSVLDDGIDTLFKASLTNVDIPIIAGIRLTDWFRIGTGPVLSYPLKEKVTYQSSANNIQISVDKTMFKEAVYSWQVCAAIDIGRLVFDLRYELGIDKMNYSIDLPNQQASVDPEINSRTWQFTIGYKFVKSE